MFIMSLGEFGDIWDALPDTRHNLIGEHFKSTVKVCTRFLAKIHFFIFIALLVILLLNLLIAMMGDTYAKVMI